MDDYGDMMWDAKYGGEVDDDDGHLDDLTWSDSYGYGGPLEDDDPFAG